MTNQFFTSDTHFNHPKIIEYGNGRPFGTYEEMEAVIVNNWNSVVGKGDLVYFLGDFCLTYGKKDLGLVDRLLSSLNGNKILVAGNHDRDEVTKNPRWSTVKDIMNIKSAIDDTPIVLCHYPMRSWNKMAYGSFMLHGHTHFNMPNPPGKIMEVGVDGWDYTPVSIKQVHEFMEKKELIGDGGHHEPKGK